MSVMMVRLMRSDVVSCCLDSNLYSFDLSRFGFIVSVGLSDCVVFCSELSRGFDVECM